MVHSYENFFMRYATAIAIIAVTFLMITAALIFYEQAETAAVARNWVDHTYEVKEHIEQLMNRLMDAASAQRGYLLTGNEDYLEPYRRAINGVPESRYKTDTLDQYHSVREEYDILIRQTADNPVQQRNMDELDHAIDEELKYLASVIELRKSKGAEALQLVDPLRAKMLMDNLRYLTRSMTHEEDHLLALRIQADEAKTRQSRILTFCGIGIFYTLMVLGIWVYQRTRKRAQTELLRYAQQLERNEEELKMQQEELKASNEEIEASNEELEEQNAQIRQQTEELALSKTMFEEKAQEADKASKYKSEFLANMSHELRTPLNSLLILSRSLATNESGNLMDEQIEEARIIYNDGLELLNLINDILDLSKVESGKLDVVTEDVPLDNIVQHMQQQFAPIAKQKKIVFPIEMASDLPASLHTDSQRVEQILKNLLSNAFKFTDKGSVTLKVHRPDQNVELQRPSLDYDTTLAFSIIDTGIGIEKSKFNHIFEAFQQEDGSIDRHYGGTGLGLTIARKFAHLLGGEIHIVSAKGAGSTFTLILPIELTPAAREKMNEPAPAAPTKNAHDESKAKLFLSVTEFIADDRESLSDQDKVLLIIEDDKNFASILMKIARKRGYKCLVAENGKSGIRLATEGSITAIILDLKLPDIDGLQVLDQLKYDLRSRHIPVHIMSGRDEGDTLISLRKGAIGYAAKPVKQESIDAAFVKIETLLQANMKQILVVEDDWKNQVAIRSLLKKKDIHITMASTGTAALGHLRAVSFDCIILDLRLPDMNGFDWLKKAEKEMADKGLPPVIVYTAKQLTEEENLHLNRYTGSIIIKGAQSPERLLDEVTLFLHSVESTLSKKQRNMLCPQHDPGKILQGKTVLLVDDDLRNTFALSKFLKRHAINVVIADNGQMALEKLSESPAIDLVIMDIMMPIMDGYQAIKELRAQKKYQALPIFALTARAMPEEQHKCLEAGANDYLTKPVDTERLLTLLRMWLFKQEIAA